MAIEKTPKPSIQVGATVTHQSQALSREHGTGEVVEAIGKDKWVVRFKKSRVELQARQEQPDCTAC